MALPEYPRPAQFRGDVPAWIVNISTIISGMLRGRQNVVGEVTLTADGETAATAVIDDRCHKYSAIHLDPLSAAAAAVLVTGETYVAAADRTEGQFTITHPPIDEGEVVALYYSIQG